MEILKLSKKAINDQDADTNDQLKFNEQKFSLDGLNVKICEISAQNQDISPLLNILKKELK